MLWRFGETGDEAAFEVLIERYAPLVRSVCWHVLHHQQDAEDAFQQILIVVMRKAKSIRKGEALKSWLHSVAYRSAKDVRKSRKRRENHECSCDPEKQPAQPAQAAQLAQLAQYGDEAEYHETQVLINTEVQRLPEKLRVPFMLHCLEGKSNREVAQQLGLPEGTVAGRLRKARKVLRRRLEQRGVAPPSKS